MKFIFSVHWN